METSLFDDDEDDDVVRMDPQQDQQPQFSSSSSTRSPAIVAPNTSSAALDKTLSASPSSPSSPQLQGVTFIEYENEDDGESTAEEITWETVPNAAFDEVVARIIMDPDNELDLLDYVFIRREADGSTLLHVVAGWANCHELVARLLRRGIPPDTRDTSGWTPLLEAAQEGQIRTCDVLLNHGATPDLAAGELTPLRAAAEVGNEEVTMWLLGQPGTWSGTWDASFFAFLLSKTPGAVATYLDRFSTVLNHSKRGYIGVRYSQLRALYGEPHVPVDETALALVVRSSSARDILQHRVMKYLLKAKWKSFARSKFRREFSAYVLLLVSYFVPTIWADPDWIQLETAFDYGVAASRALSWMCSLYLLVRVELYEFRGDSVRNYFVSFWNWLNVITYVATMASIPLEFQGAQKQDARNSVLALITVSLWVNLLQFLQVSTESGLLIAMMSHMVKDVYRFLLLYAVFIFGYSGAFYILLRGQPGYENFTNAFITVFLMLFGAIDYSVFSDKSIHGWLWHMGNLLLISHLVCVVIVLLNILIAMMATTYADVWDAAEAEAMQSHAQAILRMEKSLPKNERTAKYLKLLQLPPPPQLQQQRPPPVVSAAGATKTSTGPNDAVVFDTLDKSGRELASRDLLLTRSTTKRAITESVLTKLKNLPLAADARTAVNRALARSVQIITPNSSSVRSSAQPTKHNRSAIHPDNGDPPTTEPVNPQHEPSVAGKGTARAFRFGGVRDRPATTSSVSPRSGGGGGEGGGGGGGAAGFIENLIDVPNLNVLEQTLFLKSAFDQDDDDLGGGDGGGGAGSIARSSLAILDDGIRYELPVKKAKEHEQLAALRDLQTQVEQLTKVVMELQRDHPAERNASSRSPTNNNPHCASHMRRSFYTRPSGGGGGAPSSYQ